jgi:hypothetical protein
MARGKSAHASWGLLAQCVKLPRFWFVTYWLIFYMNHVCDAWVTNHPSHTMKIYDIPGIVNLSLYLTPSPGNISAGFKNIPLINGYFHDEFRGAYVTDRSTPRVASNSDS